MNRWEIDGVMLRFENDPVLGPASRTLVALRDAADANSDGWAYWPKPARAAAKLMTLLNDVKWTHSLDLDDPVAMTALAKDVRAAYRPIKAFRTRSGLDFEIEEPEED